MFTYLCTYINHIMAEIPNDSYGEQSPVQSPEQSPVQSPEQDSVYLSSDESSDDYSVTTGSDGAYIDDCPICLEKKQLSPLHDNAGVLHPICEECIAQLMHSTVIVICPICREVVRHSDDPSVENIPSDVIVEMMQTASTFLSTRINDEFKLINAIICMISLIDQAVHNSATREDIVRNLLLQFTSNMSNALSAENDYYQDNLVLSMNEFAIFTEHIMSFSTEWSIETTLKYISLVIAACHENQPDDWQNDLFAIILEDVNIDSL